LFNTCADYYTINSSLVKYSKISNKSIWITFLCYFIHWKSVFNWKIAYVYICDKTNFYRKIWHIINYNTIFTISYITITSNSFSL